MKRLLILLCLLFGLDSLGWADTFGHSDTAPASAVNFSASAKGSKYVASASGTVSACRVYILNTFGSTDIRFAAYQNNGSGRPQQFIASSSSVTTVNATGWSATNSTISFSAVSGTTYWIFAWANNNNNEGGYDTGTTGQGAEDSSGTYPTWPDPNGDSFGAEDRDYAIQCTLTPSGGGSAGKVLLLHAGQ